MEQKVYKSLDDIIERTRESNTQIDELIASIPKQGRTHVVVGNDFTYCVCVDDKGFAGIQVIAMNNRPFLFTEGNSKSFIASFKATNADGPIKFKPMKAVAFYEKLKAQNEKFIELVEITKSKREPDIILNCNK